MQFTWCFIIIVWAPQIYALMLHFHELILWALRLNQLPIPHSSEIGCTFCEYMQLLNECNHLMPWYRRKYVTSKSFSFFLPSFICVHQKEWRSFITWLLILDLLWQRKTNNKSKNHRQLHWGCTNRPNINKLIIVAGRCKASYLLTLHRKLKNKTSKTHTICTYTNSGKI